MTRPYSVDLRVRAVKRVLAGESIRLVGAVLGISASTVSKWSQRYRETGDVEPRQIGGYKPLVLERHRAFIHARLDEMPSLSLRRLQRELADRGVEVSYGAVWSFVHGEDLSFKKNRVRQRTRPSRRGQATGTMAEVSEAD